MPTPNKKASENARYQALRSHDARFDGQFFDLAAQAEKAGYRLCLRCRPELSPEPLAWSIQNASHTRRSHAVMGAWAGKYQNHSNSTIF